MPRKALSRVLPASFALAGLVIGIWLIAQSGFGRVTAVLGTVSSGGLSTYVAAQLGITLGLALSWRVLLRRRRGGQFLRLVWGRLVRDATGEFLPFSQVGGYVLGARVIALGGVPVADATASTFADITTEFLAQIAFIGTGLALLAHSAPRNRFLLPVGIGLAVAVCMGAGLVAAQRRAGGLIHRATLRFLSRGGDGQTQAERLQVALDGIYGAPKRILGATLLHLMCWFGTAAASFIGFRALGVELSFTDAVVIEALLHAVMATAFFVPGRVGIQEAAYVGLAAIFGIPADLAISLSLLRRGRDLIIAVPVLLAWQGVEAKQLRLPSPN